MPPERRLRVVLDANVLVSGFIGHPQSAAFRIVAHLRKGDFQLLVSTPIIGEYRDVLTRPRIVTRRRVPGYSASEILGVIVATSEWHDLPQSVFPGLRDLADAPYLLTAVAGQADYLVSGDNHLLDFATDERVRPLNIVTTRAFLEILEPAP